MSDEVMTVNGRMKDRLDRIEFEVNGIITRLTVVEQLMKDRQERTDKEIAEIKSSLKEINRNTTWLVRLIIGSIISGFLLWVINGGMAGAS